MRLAGALLLLASVALALWGVATLFGAPWAAILLSVVTALAGAGLVVEVPPRR